MRLTLIIASLIFFALLTYAKLIAVAPSTAYQSGPAHLNGINPSHSPILMRDSN
jgi:hypothetical protein